MTCQYEPTRHPANDVRAIPELVHGLGVLVVVGEGRKAEGLFDGALQAVMVVVVVGGHLILEPRVTRGDVVLVRRVEIAQQPIEATDRDRARWRYRVS